MVDVITNPAFDLEYAVTDVQANIKAGKWKRADETELETRIDNYEEFHEDTSVDEELLDKADSLRFDVMVHFEG